MRNLRRTTAVVATTALIATPLALATASPAGAAERDFRYAGAEIDFEVEKDDGRFEVDLDIDDARPGTRWRVVLRHDGKRFHKRVHRADGDGDVIDLERTRRNTAGKDVFRVTVKRIGGPKAVKRTIRLR